MMTAPPPHPSVEAFAGVFRALGDETRLRLVALLADGELCVCHLVAALELPQPTVSRHLAVLRSAGLVRPRRSGSWIHYTLAEPTDEAVGRVLRELTASLSTAERSADLDRLRRSMGPGACP